MSWDRVVVCITPYPLSATAALVGQMLDSDTGGAASFGVLASKSGAEPATHCVLAARCGDDLADATPHLIADPTLLLESITRDFGLRFPDSDVPTLAEVTDFCAKSSLSVDVDLFSALSEQGLVVILSENAE